MDRWIILFMDGTEPSIRVVEGTESEAQVLAMRIRHIYDDPEARAIHLHPTINHNEIIEGQYFAMAPD